VKSGRDRALIAIVIISIQLISPASEEDIDEIINTIQPLGLSISIQLISPASEETINCGLPKG